jgi:probable HAF family extracellular repeat protein
MKARNRVLAHGTAMLCAMLVCAPALAEGEALPRFTVVDFIAIGGGASAAVALNQADVFTAHTATGIWAVNARTGEARQVDGSCRRCVGRGINTAGDVVGEEAGPFAFTYLAFLVRGDERVRIPPFAEGVSSFANAINDLGEVVGEAEVAPDVLHAFVFRDGTMTDLGIFRGGQYSYALAINNRSQIVGAADVDGIEHAFLFDPEEGRLRDLGKYFSYSRATAINDEGVIVGVIYVRYPREAPFSRAAVFDDHGVHDLGVLENRKGSTALGINNRGQIVGLSTSPDLQNSRGFLYMNGSMHDLNDVIEPTDLVITEARAINDHEIIIANARTPSGAQHAVALLPIDPH